MGSQPSSYPPRYPTGHPTGYPTTKYPTAAPTDSPTLGHVQCGQTYQFNIKNANDKWEPQLCGHAGKTVTLTTCPSTGTLQDTRIYGLCRNDDHGGNGGSDCHRLHAWCQPPMYTGSGARR